ncbi:MAG: Gldg family protein [Planctomycetaceae bacterium]
MLRSHVILAVFLRNLSSYFSGVLGYLFIIVFVVSCAWTAFSPRFFTNNLATLDQLSEAFPLLLLFMVPAVTMTSWAEERRQGTDELLFTLPATDFEILLGKYLAMLAVYTIALAFSSFKLFVLDWYAEPDWGLMFTTYVGYWLAGGTLLAAGMFASVLTNSMTVAFVLGVVVCLVPVFGDKLAYFAVEAVPFAWVLGGALITVALLIQFLLTTPNRAAVFTLAGVGGFLKLSSLVWFVVKAAGGKIEFAPTDFAPFGLGEQMRDFSLGLIPLTSLVYFLSLTAYLLYLNAVMIGKRHWSGGREGATMGFQFVVRCVSLAVALASVNVLVVKLSESGWLPVNLDLTTEKLFTLSPSTTDLIAKISKDRPVKIQAFISTDVPREQVTIQKRLKGLLRQYDREGGARLEVRFVDVAPFTPEAEEARLLGVLPNLVFTDEDGRRGTQEVFLGVVISSPVDEVVVPVFEAGTPIEYELTRSIRTVANEKRLTVGMLTTDAKVAGGLDMQSFRQTPEWRIQTELKKQYKVEQVSADMPIDDKKYDVLMAVWPSSLTALQMQNLVAYVKQGKPTLIFDDPLPYFDGQGQNAPRMQKPRPGGMFGGMNQPPEPKAEDGKLTSLLRLLEITWDNGQVVFDLAGMGLHPEFASQINPELVFISPKTGNISAIHQTSPVTSGLQEVLTFFPGEIQQRKGSELKFDALLRTRGERNSGVLQWEEITKPGGMFGAGIEIEQNPPRTLTDDAYTIAAHITAKDTKDPKGIKAIFVADADIISNQLFSLEASQQLPNLRIDNIKFVLNCVDVLAGETAYIELRKRRPQLRTLTAIQEVSNKLREEQTKERGLAESEAKDQFEKAQKQLDDAVAQIEKDTSLTPGQKNEKIRLVRATLQRTAEVARSNIEREKRQKMDRSEAKTKRQIRAYEDQIRWRSILFPPIPALILGIIVLSTRINAEYRNVEADRLVKR